MPLHQPKAFLFTMLSYAWQTTRLYLCVCYHVFVFFRFIYSWFMMRMTGSITCPLLGYIWPWAFVLNQRQHSRLFLFTNPNFQHLTCQWVWSNMWWIGSNYGALTQTPILTLFSCDGYVICIPGLWCSLQPRWMLVISMTKRIQAQELLCHLCMVCGGFRILVAGAISWSDRYTCVQ